MHKGGDGVPLGDQRYIRLPGKAEGEWAFLYGRWDLFFCFCGTLLTKLEKFRYCARPETWDHCFFFVLFLFFLGESAV